MKLLYLVESGESKFLVFDEMPDKISTKYGDDTIIGRIGGIFYDFLAKRNGRREAFGGRKFDIILDNGKVEKCEGQWWDEDRVGLESSEFDYYEVEYPTVEENKGATIFISHLDSCLGWDNEEEEK